MGGGLLAVSAAAALRMPEPVVPEPLAEGVLDELIPKQIGGWTFQTSSGVVLPPPDPLAEKLYNQVLTRVYQGENMPGVALLIAYSNIQNGLLQLHRPEICYPASGYSLTDTQVERLPLESGRSIPVRHFFAQGRVQSEEVIYWTRLGNDIPTSWAAQRWAVVRANLREEIPDGILVRFSLLRRDDERNAVDILTAFINALLASVTPSARKLLVGDI